MALWRLLGGQMPRIGLYASGINPTAPERVAAERRAAGYRAFKLKIGFPDAEGTAVLADDAGLGPTPDWSLLSEFAVSV